jgi:hypothetical protein
MAAESLFILRRLPFVKWRAFFETHDDMIAMDLPRSGAMHNYG